MCRLDTLREKENTMEPAIFISERGASSFACTLPDTFKVKVKPLYVRREIKGYVVMCNGVPVSEGEMG